MLHCSQIHFCRARSTLPWAWGLPWALPALHDCAPVGQNEQEEREGVGEGRELPALRRPAHDVLKMALRSRGRRVLAAT